jgi:cytochrome c553
MKKQVVFLMACAMILFAGCSKKTALDQPKVEVMPPKVEAPKVMATTFAANIQPLVLAKCAPCHTPSKAGNKADLENYISAKAYAADMVKRVEMNPTDRGFMPFRHDKLADEDIALLKKWVSDGTLEK